MNRRLFTALAIVALAGAPGCGSNRKSPGGLSAAQKAYDAGQYDRCVELCTTALDAGGAKADACLLRGKAYDRQGDYGRAIADFEKVRRDDPTRGEACFRQARCHLALGQADQAATTMEWCISTVYGSLSVGDQMLAHAMYGEVHLAAGDNARAVEELEAAIKVANGSRSLKAGRATSVVHYNLSRAHFERGNFRRARETYQSYLDAAGSADPEDTYTLAVLHFLCGDIRRSRETTEKLPPELKVRMEAVLSGEAFSVRAIYEQNRKDKEQPQDDNR